MPVHPHIRGVYGSGPYHKLQIVGPSPHTWGLRTAESPCPPAGRSIPTYVGFTRNRRARVFMWPVHPHIRGVYLSPPNKTMEATGPSPHTWGLLFLCCDNWMVQLVHPHIRGVYGRAEDRTRELVGPSPHTWGLLRRCGDGNALQRSIPTYVGFTGTATSAPVLSAVHPHIRGVYTEIKSKISRASSKTALLPAEKFKILFLVKIKSSAAAFQVHTIFRDQFPPGLHFEIALHL